MIEFFKENYWKLLLWLMLSIMWIVNTTNVFAAVNIVENSNLSSIDAKLTSDWLVRFDWSNLWNYNSLLPIKIRDFSSQSEWSKIVTLYDSVKTSCWAWLDNIYLYKDIKHKYVFSASNLTYSFTNMGWWNINCDLSIVWKLSSLHKWYTFNFISFWLSDDSIFWLNYNLYLAYNNELWVMYQCMNSSCSKFRNYPIYSYISTNFWENSVMKIMTISYYGPSITDHRLQILWRINWKLYNFYCTTSCSHSEIDSNFWSEQEKNAYINTQALVYSNMKYIDINWVYRNLATNALNNTVVNSILNNWSNLSKKVLHLWSSSYNSRYPTFTWLYLNFFSLNWSLFTKTEYEKNYKVLQFNNSTIVEHCLIYDYVKNKRIYWDCRNIIPWEGFEPDPTWTWWTWWTWWLWDVITDVWLDYIDWLWFNFDNNQNSWFCSEYSGWNINQYCSSYCSASLKSLCQKCATWLSPAEFSTLYASCSFPASTWQFSSNNWDVVWYWDNWIVMFQKKDIVACNFQANGWCPEEFTLLDSVDYITCRVAKVWENIWKVWKTFKTIFWIFIFSESNLVWQDVLKLNWVSFTLWEDWERVYIYNTDASKIYSMLMNSIFTWWDILLAMYLWYSIIIFLLSKKEEKND